MFESAREKIIIDEKKSQKIKNEIKDLIKSYNLSLSQIRGLFHNIINEIEDTPL